MRLDHTDRTRFIEEARLMHQLHHPRIVQLLGVCTQPDDQPVYIITELMEKGALVDFLRSEESQHLKLNDLIDMMAQVGSVGMNGMFIFTQSYLLCKRLLADQYVMWVSSS
ncbi:hypothetical protein AHF37_11916 [Paragonimus kellicotti]|nr:hypothetical protein AHF37_11916 [Paragonimus kellicotti]